MRTDSRIARLGQFGVICLLTLLLYIGLFYLCRFLFEKHFFDNITEIVITNKTISIFSIVILVITSFALILLLDNNKSISFVRKNFVVIILLLIYVFFYRYWEDIIGDYIIGKFLCHFKSSILNDAIFIVAFYFVVWFGTYRLGKKNINRTFIWVLVILFWVYYRWICKSCGSNDAPYYLHFKSVFFDQKGGVKYIDVIPLIAICQIVVSVLSRIMNNLKRKKLIQWKRYESKNYLDILDNPIMFEDQDILMRNRFAKSAIDELIKADLSGGSFTFGIDSPWGAGKTSFMNLMKNQMEKYDSDRYYRYSFIIMDFNPWLYVAEKNLVTAFFDELSKHLEPYDHSLAKNFIDYSKLLSAFDTKETKLIASLIDLTKENDNSSLKTKKRQITDALEETQKPIFVFIDDLDRLNADELMEMLKLIRNTSNFPYMCFVAAYDRAYLIECLEKQMKTKGNNFVEKIFQHEFHLPPCPTEVLRKTLFALIVNSEDFKKNNQDKNILENYIKKNEESNPLNGLSNLREVKRLAMHFLASYRNVMYVINVVDLLLIELIKTKYPLVFYFFESKKDVVLEIRPDNHNYYKLFKGENDINHIDFLGYIRHNRKEFKLSHLDRLTIEAVFNILFPDKLDINGSKRINEIEWFNRYIDLTELETSIPIKEFEDALKNDITVFKKAMDRWLQSDKPISLRYRILNHEARNHDEQNKLIESAFYLISKDIPIDDYKIDRLITNLKESNNNYADEDKDFIAKLLKEYWSIRAIRQYIGHINNRETTNALFSQKEIVNIQQEVFRKFQENNTRAGGVLKCFCELLVEYDWYLIYRRSEYEKKNKDFIESMKTYAEKNMSSFIPCIVKIGEHSGSSDGLNKYIIDDITELIWGSMDKFYSYFKIDGKDNEDDKNPVISEFKRFLKDYKENNYKKTKFPFEHIKPEGWQK